ncbi:MAG: hypothetical protein PHC51_13615 [bacterium]|nr:hypothetical protein [bacterium]
MNSFDKLHDICTRLEHIESNAEWIARSMVHVDNSACQTGTLISVLADEVRGKILDLVTELEKEILESQGSLSRQLQ